MFVYILSVILTLIAVVFLFVPPLPIFKKIYTKKNIILYCCTGFSFLLFLLECAGVLDAGGYRFITFYVFVIGAFASVYSTVHQKASKLLLDLLKIFIVVIIAEVFVFNINSLHLYGKKYNVGELNIRSATTTNFDGLQNISQGYTALEFNNLSERIGTIKVDASSTKRTNFEIFFDVTDDTHMGNYRLNNAKIQIIEKNEATKQGIFNFFGDVHDLKIHFDANEGEKIYVNKITINEPIVMNFSLLRFAIVFLFFGLIYLLKNLEVFKRPYVENSKTINLIAYGMTVVLCIFALFLTNCGRSGDLKGDFSSLGGNQMTKELVDAFMKGQTHLVYDNVNPKLESIANPYDWSLRESENVGAYPWDHLLYNGKYYSYYGIAPVLLMFLPYKAITGYYFPSCWAVWLFGVGGIWFLTAFFLTFIKKFFKNLKGENVILSLLLLQVTSGIWFCFKDGNFYEIAQSSGFLCTVGGAYFLLKSNIIGEGKIKNIYCALSSVFLALGVLCRPTLAVYCIAALFFIFFGFYVKHNKKFDIKYILATLLPFVVIGSVQMIYNYARFNSVFDFGIQYSLTINDFTRTEFHTQLATIGFANYLFNLPGWSETFPFFQRPQVLTFNPQGYYFVATSAITGLCFKALPVLSYKSGFNAYKACESVHKKFYALLIAVTCIACPFAIILSIWESGYGARYCVDFAWQFILGAYVIAFTLYEKSSGKRILDKLLRLSTFLGLYFSFGEVYMWVANSAVSNYQIKLLNLGRLFEFWR